MAAFEIHYSSPRRHRLLRFPPGLGWGEKGGGGLERNERGRGERESGRRRVRWLARGRKRGRGRVEIR